MSVRLSKPSPPNTCVFVVLNKHDQGVGHYIVLGQRLLDGQERFDLSDEKFAGIYATALAKSEGAWKPPAVDIHRVGHIVCMAF